MPPESLHFPSATTTIFATTFTTTTKHHSSLNPSPKFPSPPTPSIISLPPKPQKTQINPNNNFTTEFQEKLVYLDTLGIDLIPLLTSHPPIVFTPISALKSTISYLITFNLTPYDIRRAINMCPSILTTHIVPVLTFLLREVRGLQGDDIRHVIHRRPRLLVCNVDTQLRPTLYFLHTTVGITNLKSHTDLLSCSVEDKFMPRIHYFQNIGFCYRDAISMFRRFPSLFCYSIKDNLEPKFNYFVVEMGRDLKELKEFPHYFSFSLENRIKPRHRHCVEKGVCLSLPLLLKGCDEQFLSKVDVCCSSSLPIFANSG